MKAKKLVLTIACCLAMLCGILSENIQEVQAEETSTDNSEIVRVVNVEVNSSDAFDQIKTVLITTMLFEEAGVDRSLVDIAGSEMYIEQVDTTKVGVQEVNVMINIKPISDSTELIKSSISSKVSLNVVDTQAPTLVLTQDVAYVQVNSEFNPWDYLSYTFDNSNQDMYQVLEIDGSVDPYTEGEYYLTYKVEDASGNIATASLTAKVSRQIVVRGGVASGDEITTMLQLINDARAQNGLSALQLADEAGQTAIAIRAVESVNDVSHRRPDGSHYKTALSDQGVTWDHSPLEILTSSGSSVYSKFNWWINSTGHRSILMQPNYDTIAIGYSGSMWAAIVY